MSKLINMLMKMRLIGFSEFITFILFGLSVSCSYSSAEKLDSKPQIKNENKSEFILIKRGLTKIGSPLDEPGRFSIENELVRREVLIEKDFLIKSTEVTQGEWEKLMGNNPSRFKSCGKNCPVERVSFFDVILFLNIKSNQDRLESCYEMKGCKGEPNTGCSNDVYICKSDFICEEIELKKCVMDIDCLHLMNGNMRRAQVWQKGRIMVI